MSGAPQSHPDERSSSRFTLAERGKDTGMRAMFGLYVVVIVAGLLAAAAVALLNG